MTAKRGSAWRRWQVWGGAALLGACGCASFFDEITTNSKERDLGRFIRRPEPLVVLRDSTDHQRKAEALVQLKEPLTHGGTKDQQELYLQILSRAALNDSAGKTEPLSRDPLCRLSAIRTLGEYKDPRAVDILEKAYLDSQPFSPDLNALVRQQTLAALERTGNPEARHVLIRAARQPVASATSSQTERQQILDEKLAAVRALSKFPQSDSVQTLVYLLETEKDVAVKHCVHESLKTTTKKNLPEDAAAWRTMLDGGQPAAEPNFIQRVTGTGTRPDAKKN